MGNTHIMVNNFIELLLFKMNAFLTKLYPSWLEGIVPIDKFMHFLSGAILGIILTPFIGWASILWVSAIAMLKEVYDYLNPDKHTPDVWDWVATSLGGVAGVLLVTVL